MKTILVPTDFSKTAEAALETAIALAKRTNAELILLHVVDQPSSDSFNVEGEGSPMDSYEDKPLTMKLIEKARKQMDQAYGLVKRSGVSVKKEMSIGNPFHGIHTLITGHKADLVVMGTEGHSRLDKLIIGSTTEKVVRQAKCPVLTVHRKPLDSDFKNIVYATSLLEDEDRFSGVVVRLQELFDATLHIVWINTPELFQTDPEVKEKMRDFAIRLKLRKYTMNVFCDYSEEAGILHFADSINADLISMATHGRKGLARVLSGSIAEDVSNNSRRPVLTSVLK